MTKTVLTVTDHRRDVAGMTYIYPVVSRRAGGVSVGVNLNPNNACNWQCVYCQVPDLRRGTAPPIDLARLETELRQMLADILTGSFMQERVPEEARRLNDIALSGNGEPTSAKAFADIIALIGRVMTDFHLLDKIKLVLITNGSLVHRPAVQAGIAAMAALNGEVWFKVDRATREGIRTVNNVAPNLKRMADNLALSASLCPTWVQTCMFAMDGALPDATERAAYLDFLQGVLARGVPLKGVLLYGLARTSMQPEAGRLSAADAAWMQAFQTQIQALNLPVKLSL